MAKWFKDNAVNLALLLITISSGIGAFALDAGAMFTTFPLQSVLLAVFAFLLGGLAFRFALTQTQRAKDKRVLEKVKGLPPQLLSAIQRTYIEGTYTANCYDTTAQYLLELGFLGAPRQVSILDVTPFMLQPWFKRFLDRNYDKVFGK